MIHPDAVLLIFNYRRETHPKAIEIARKLKEISQKFLTPIALCYFTEIDPIYQLEKEIEYPIYTEVNDAIKSLAYSRNYYQKKKARTLYRSGKKKIISPPNAKYNVSKILENLKSEELQISDALKICQEYGLPVADYQVVLSEEEAIGFAERAGYPFVIKVAGAGSLHKTDVGGVILIIQNQNGVVQAIQKIRTSLYAHKLTGAPKYLVQKMLSVGREIIIGGKQDPAFGPIVLYGLGDIYADVFKDVNLCLAPVFYEEAEEMLLTLKGYDYLRGVRGEKGVEIEKLSEIIVRVSQLMADFPQILELDLNPVLAFEKEVSIVDARIILKSQD